MADFNIAYAALLVDEGGYSDDPHDPGGETYHGVSRNNFPSWEGWAIIDAMKANAGFPKVLDSIPQLQDAVKLFYLNNFWKFSALPSQSLANKLLSESANMGLREAVKIL